MGLNSEVTCSGQVIRSGCAAPVTFHHTREGHTTPVLFSSRYTEKRVQTQLKGTGALNPMPLVPLLLSCPPTWLARFGVSRALAFQSWPEACYALIQSAFSRVQAVSQVLLRCSLQSRRTMATPIFPCFSCFEPFPKLSNIITSGSETVSQFSLCFQ